MIVSQYEGKIAKLATVVTELVSDKESKSKSFRMDYGPK